MLPGLRAKDVHLVLVQALLAAELELDIAVLEVHEVDRVPDVFAPLTDLRK